MFPASMYLFALSPGYRPAISQATLNGDACSLRPRIGATLVPVIFLSLYVSKTTTRSSSSMSTMPALPSIFMTG